jgi:hypothetical protein
MARSRLLILELLESRDVPALFGVPWADGRHLTLSFVPDGTNVDGASSSLFSNVILGSTAAWENTVLRAAETWAAPANINVGVVPDSGDPLGTSGAVQGDSRFGDIRIAARPLSGNVLAITEPPNYLDGTRGGDIVLNSNYTFSYDGTANTYDLYSVLLHELGHSFGLADSFDPTSAMDEDYDGLRTGLSIGDVANIQALYGVRAPDTFAGNNQPATAFPLTRPAASPAMASLVAFGDITNPGEADYFTVQTLAFNPFGLTVRLNVGWSLLAPRVTVFDPNGEAVATNQSTNPQSDTLIVSLWAVQPNATYTIKVEAANPAFAVGGYKLRVVSNPFAANMLIEGSGGVMTPDMVGHAVETATGLSTPSGYSPDSHYSAAAGLTDGTDADFFVVHSPAAAADQQNVLTVNVWSAQPATLAPVAYVFDSTGQPVAASVLANNSGTYTLQIADAGSDQGYYVEVAAGNVGGHGQYQLDVDVRSQAVNLQQFASNTLSAAASTDYTGLTINRSQLLYFSLAGGSVPDGVQAGVRMAIFDSNGHVVTTLFAESGQTVSASVFLDVGTYTIRVEELTPVGVLLPTMSYSLQGLTLTDPISTVPSDPTLSTTSPDYSLVTLPATIYSALTYDLLGDVIW